MWSKIKMILLSFMLSIVALFSLNAFALLGKIDLLGYGGYSAVGAFSDASLNTTAGVLKGSNVGASFLLTPFSRILGFTLGVGVDNLNVKNSSNTVAGISANTTLNSVLGLGHAGIRISVPFIKLFAFGNMGTGLSDTYSEKITALGTTITLYDKLSNHTLYGASVYATISILPMLMFGVGGVYNIHTVTLKDTTGASASLKDIRFREVSANAVLALSL